MKTKISSATPADDSRQELIAQAAYRRWEGRGFGHGGDLQDWLEAEAEFDTAHRSVMPATRAPRTK
jgi:hypothetical protein